MFIDNDWPMVAVFETGGVTIKGGADPHLTDLDALKHHPLVGTAARKLDWAQGHLAALEYNVGRVFTSRRTTRS
jgi:hypothetical protein